MLNYQGAQYRIAQIQAYYHGTPSEATAKKILRAGKLKPGDLRGGAMAPIPGRVYMTPSLSYVLPYVLGACASSSTSYLCEQGGRYGYLFVLRPNQVASAIPDEDAVGELLCANLYLYRQFERLTRQHSLEFVGEIDRVISEFTNDPNQEDFDGEFYDFSANLRDCMFPEVAVAGRFFLKYANEDELADLRDELPEDVAVSTAGAVVFAEAWRFDKTKARQLAADGSNFFELAKRVK